MVKYFGEALVADEGTLDDYLAKKDQPEKFQIGFLVAQQILGAEVIDEPEGFKLRYVVGIEEVTPEEHEKVFTTENYTSMVEAQEGPLFDLYEETLEETTTEFFTTYFNGETGNLISDHLVPEHLSAYVGALHKLGIIDRETKDSRIYYDIDSNFKEKYELTDLIKGVTDSESDLAKYLHGAPETEKARERHVTQRRQQETAIVEYKAPEMGRVEGWLSAAYMLISPTGRRALLEKWGNRIQDEQTAANARQRARRRQTIAELQGDPLFQEYAGEEVIKLHGDGAKYDDLSVPEKLRLMRRFDAWLQSDSKLVEILEDAAEKVAKEDARQITQIMRINSGLLRTKELYELKDKMDAQNALAPAMKVTQAEYLRHQADLWAEKYGSVGYAIMTILGKFAGGVVEGGFETLTVRPTEVGHNLGEKFQDFSYARPVSTVGALIGGPIAIQQYLTRSADPEWWIGILIVMAGLAGGAVLSNTVWGLGKGIVEKVRPGTIAATAQVSEE